jgi:integrase
MKHIDIREKRGSGKDKALAPEERLKLLQQLKEDKHRIVLLLGAYAGLRPNEICQCRFSWLEKKVIGEKEVLAINIPEEDRDIKNKLKIWRPKTRKKRTTYIFESDIYNEVFFWYKSNPNGIFISRQAVHNFVKSYFIPIIEREDFSTHALRSTCQNYLLYEKNYEVKFVAIALGHSDIRTTQKFYTTMNKASAESYLINQLK